MRSNPKRSSKINPISFQGALISGGRNRMERMQNEFMRRAIELAVESAGSNGGGPFGAVIISGGEIVAEGANQVAVVSDPTAHAEVVAIRRACARLQNFQLSECEIYSSCEPCPMCLGAIYWARIRAIHFAASADDAAQAGFADRAFYDQLRLSRDKRAVPMRQLLREQGLAAFKVWERKADKIQY